MARDLTPKYTALRDSLLSWSNRDRDIFGGVNNTAATQTAQLDKFLSYAADDAYRELRIPPMERELTYTVQQSDIYGSPNISVLGTNNWAGTGGLSYCKIPLPPDYTQMKSVRLGTIAQATSVQAGANYTSLSGIIFNERTDERTFFDIYAETYGNFYWMRKENYIYIKPALAVGTQLVLSYYRLLPALNAVYSVLPANYLFQNTTPPVPQVTQPLLTELPGAFFQASTGTTLTPIGVSDVQGTFLPGDAIFRLGVKVATILSATATTVTVDTAITVPTTSTVYQYGPFAGDGTGSLFFITIGGTRAYAFSTLAAAVAALPTVQATYPTAVVNTQPFPFYGGEAGNWLKDQNERIVIWGALAHMGAFLDDDKIEARYTAKFEKDIFKLNNEEKMRQVKGGNYQVHFNGGGLI